MFRLKQSEVGSDVLGLARLPTVMTLEVCWVQLHPSTKK